MKPSIFSTGSISLRSTTLLVPIQPLVRVLATRPLWQFTVVEGLTEGRGALLAKMHHTITDGVGGVRLKTPVDEALSAFETLPRAQPAAAPEVTS